jgi:hypothetical protein
MGATATIHEFRPSAVTYKDLYADTAYNISQGKKIYGLEAAVYAEDEMRIGKNFKLNPGLRIALFSVRGKSYFSPEPRLGMSYNILSNFAAKASYALMQQNIHLLSSSTIGMPTDLWVPSTSNIKPQRSQQAALGLAYDLKKPQLSFSLEGYYKTMNRMIAYKEGTGFFFFDVAGDILDGDVPPMGELVWEKNLTTGKGWAYGMEFLVRRTTGKFTGWIGYTLSWTLQQFKELNFGKKFYARYDRRHDVSIVLMYEVNKRVNLSAAWVYATGNAVTIPESIYAVEGLDRNIYSYLTKKYGIPEETYWWYNGIESYGERNNQRMQPFHHLDLSIQIKTKKSFNRKWEGMWEVSVYNVYNNKNAFFYMIDTEYSWRYDEYRYVLKKVCIFPIIPSISYNFKF